MVTVRHILNKTTEVNPIDRNGIYIEVNFDQDAIINQVRPHAAIGNLYFAREDVALFRSYIDAGINGTGPGIFEGVPYDIELTYPDGSQRTLNYYVDLTDGLKISKDGVQVGLKLYEGLDWLNDRVDGFTFQSLYDTDEFHDLMKSKFVYVPYVINNTVTGMETFTTVLTMSTMVLQIIKEITSLAKQVALLIAADVIGDIGVLIGVIIELAYVVAMLVTLVGILTDFVLTIIQPIKYQVGMYIKDLLEIACNHLGLSFSSSVFSSAPMKDFVILPQRYELKSTQDELQSYSKVLNTLEQFLTISLAISDGLTGFGLNVMTAVFDAIQNIVDAIVGFGNDIFLGKLKGYPTIGIAQFNNAIGFPSATGGDILMLAKQLINGKIVIKNGTLYLEPRDYNLSSALYQLPPVRKDWVGYNTNEFYATQIFSFDKDLNDKNVIDNYAGTSYEVYQKPTIVNNTKLILTKSMNRIDIPYARGINKKSLTAPEQMVQFVVNVMNGFLDGFQLIVDTAIDIVNLVTNIVPEILTAITDLFTGVINWFIDQINAVISPLEIPYVSIPSSIIDAFAVAIYLVIGIGTTNPFYFFLAILGALSVNFDDINIPSATDLLGPDRIDCLMLENDMLDTPKIVHLAELDDDRMAKLSQINPLVVRAKYIYDNFYGTNNFVPNTNGEHNQYEIITPALNKPGDENKIPFTAEDMELLISDNKFLDDNGEVCLLDTMKFYVEQGFAFLTYRKKKIYTNNLTLKTSEPTGY